MTMADEAEISILLLGDTQVGKSTFLSRITRGQNAPPNTALPVLPDLDQPFIFDLRTRRGTYRLEFSDTASPTNFTLLRPHVLILCYAIPDRTTLTNVSTRWKPLLETHFNYDEARPVMLLGLQRDRRREGDDAVVFPPEALRVAAELRCDRYAECSARTGELCREVFEDVVKLAVGTRMDGGGKSAGADCVVA